MRLDLALECLLDLLGRCDVKGPDACATAFQRLGHKAQRAAATAQRGPAQGLSGCAQVGGLGGQGIGGGVQTMSVGQGLRHGLGLGRS